MCLIAISQHSLVNAVHNHVTYARASCIDLRFFAEDENSQNNLLQAYQDKELLVMKVFDDSKVEGITSFMAELKAYQALRDLQGATIPMLHSFGRMGHTGCPAIITHWAGHTFKADQLSTQLRAAAKQALCAMHACYVGHGDVRLDNMSWKQGHILFCDLRQSSINSTSVKSQQDFEMLDALYD